MKLGSSLRDCPAEETVRAAGAVCAAFGISRVTCITRLDRLGLPVYASVRPRGGVLRVHAGKGLRDVEARAGAVMEALEFGVAEAAARELPQHTVSLAAWTAAFEGRLKLVDFAPLIGRRVAADERLAVLRCETLGSAATVLLPRELVVLDAGAPAAPPLFGVSTNGLASGNGIEEATLHGLLEVLERDASTLDAVRKDSVWVDPAGLPEPFACWAAHWSTLGIELIVRRLRSDFGLPCYAAYLHDAAGEVNLAGGCGLHLDDGMALARAICEAAQSRLSFIHGGRDDIGGFYARRNGADAQAAERSQAALIAELRARGSAAAAATVGAAVAPPPQGMSGRPADALRWLLAMLAAKGFGPVFRFVFPPPGPGLAVVRVVVPRCEAWGSGGERMGPRLFALATGRE